MDIFRHTFQDFVIIENKIWFSSSVMNGIFCADIDGGHAELIAVFPKDELFQFRLYTGIYAYEDCLIFIPHNADQFCVYNISKRSFSYLKPPIGRSKRKGRIYITMQWNEKIFIFNDYMNDMVILNTNEYTFQTCPIPANIRKKISRFWGAGCIVDDRAYMVVENLLVIVYLERNEIALQEIGEQGTQFTVITCNKNQFWITDCENQLYLYQLGERKAKRELLLIQNPVECPLPLVYGTVCEDNYIWIFFHKVEYMLRVDLFSMESVDFPLKEYDQKFRYMEYKYLDTQKQEIRILLQGEDRHRVLNISSGVWKQVSFETPLEELIDMYRGHPAQFVNNMKEIGLGNGLETLKVCLALQEQSRTSGISNNCGKKIYCQLS